MYGLVHASTSYLTKYVKRIGAVDALLCAHLVAEMVYQICWLTFYIRSIALDQVPLRAWLFPSITYSVYIAQSMFILLDLFLMPIDHIDRQRRSCHMMGSIIGAIHLLTLVSGLLAMLIASLAALSLIVRMICDIFFFGFLFELPNQTITVAQLAMFVPYLATSAILIFAALFHLVKLGPTSVIDCLFFSSSSSSSLSNSPITPTFAWIAVAPLITAVKQKETLARSIVPLLPEIAKFAYHDDCTVANKKNLLITPTKTEANAEEEEEDKWTNARNALGGAARNEEVCHKRQTTTAAIPATAIASGGHDDGTAVGSCETTLSKKFFADNNATVVTFTHGHHGSLRAAFSTQLEARISAFVTTRAFAILTRPRLLHGHDQSSSHMTRDQQQRWVRLASNLSLMRVFAIDDYMAFLHNTRRALFEE